MSEWVGKEPCPECGSTDNLGRHQDGHAYCFGCGYYEHGDGTPKNNPKKANHMLLDGTVIPLEKRKLTLETCEKWNYRTGTHNGKPVQIATYCDEAGSPVAQKVRFPDKSFVVVGDLKKAAPLYGSWLWREGGRMVVVTEGELDALSVSQMQGNKWPVCSVPNGAQGAAAAFKKALPYLDKFESVVICFDQDKPGREAAQACAELLPPGKAKIVSLPLKDASDMLQAGRGKELIDALWGAKTFRPDGIVNAADTWDRVEKYMDATYDLPQFPWPQLNDRLKGIWPARIILITAGTGIGKSTICGEIAYHLLQTRPEDERIGYIALEETVEESDLRFMSLALNTPLLANNPYRTTEEGRAKLKDAFQSTCGSGRLLLYDHWGSLDGDNLISKIRYLAKGEGCKYIFLDHVSIVVSGNDEITDERRAIDNLMTKLAMLNGELHDVSIIIVSHLKRTSSTPHEEGGQVSISDLRGSQSLGQLSHVIIAGERNQQAESEGEANRIQLRILKNRPAARTGLADALVYSNATGRLSLDEGDFKPETDVEF